MRSTAHTHPPSGGKGTLEAGDASAVAPEPAPALVGLPLCVAPAFLLLLLLLLPASCCMICVPAKTTWRLCGLLPVGPSSSERGGSRSATATGPPASLLPLLVATVGEGAELMAAEEAASFRCGTDSPVSIASFTMQLPRSTNKSHGT